MFSQASAALRINGLAGLSAEEKRSGNVERDERYAMCESFAYQRIHDPSPFAPCLVRTLLPTFLLALRVGDFGGASAGARLESSPSLLAHVSTLSSHIRTSHLSLLIRSPPALSACRAAASRRLRVLLPPSASA
ncbi:unnamed protein product [Closterium sp. Naga37s-1]|nr:unnamed protein product [Closterium sp. Naga37s-1]